MKCKTKYSELNHFQLSEPWKRGIKSSSASFVKTVRLVTRATGSVWVCDGTVKTKTDAKGLSVGPPRIGPSRSSTPQPHPPLRSHPRRTYIDIRVHNSLPESIPKLLWPKRSDRDDGHTKTHVIISRDLGSDKWTVCLYCSRNVHCIFFPDRGWTISHYLY